MKKLNIINNIFREFPFDETESFIEVSDEEYQKIISNELIYKNGQLIENIAPQIISQINSLKQQLQKFKEDVEQVELFGMERPDYSEKKQQCANIILQLRTLENQLKEL